jgi:signal peptidase I
MKTGPALILLSNRGDTRMQNESSPGATPRNPWVALVLSVLVPGLGQLYNGQARKGIFFFSAILFLIAVTALTSLELYFWGFCLILGGMAAFRLYVIVDAIFVARRSRDFVPRGYNKPILYFVIALVVIAAVNIVDFRALLGVSAFRVPSESSKPALEVGDFIMAQLDPDRRMEPQRGEIWVFLYPGDHRTHYIKRVVAFPYESVELHDGRLYINGEPRTEPWADYAGRGVLILNPHQGPYQVPEGSLFVLGDNISNSVDSRSFGALETELLVGRACYIYFSFESRRPGVGVRWKRIGMDLRPNGRSGGHN